LNFEFALIGGGAPLASLVANINSLIIQREEEGSSRTGL
jgi:hypothetical protein